MIAMPGMTAATWFGKLPSRGDFVKGGGHAQLIHMLDTWVAKSMERISDDPRWKIAYDSAPRLDFAFVGARSPLAVVGHLRPSHDTSNRRFPFLAAAAIERDERQPFLPAAPLAFSRLWSRFGGIVDHAFGAEDPAGVLRELACVDCAEEIRQSTQNDPLGRFVRGRTLQCLADMLHSGARPVNVRRIVLALGLLLRPLLGRGRLTIEKDLSLPLPGDPMYRDLVAGLWLALVGAFLRQSESELQLLIGGEPGRARLVIGFNGAAPRTLANLLSSAATAEAAIALDDPAWVEEHHDLYHDYGVAKLSSYLAQPAIALESVLGTFREVFLGE